MVDLFITFGMDDDAVSEIRIRGDNNIRFFIVEKEEKAKEEKAGELVK